MQRVLILGAGGHAQVVADILMRAHDLSGQVCPIGYLDDNPDRHGQTLLGLPVLGRIADLHLIAHDALIIAIGDNRLRSTLFDALQQQGERFGIARHPAAVIARDVRICPGAMICAGVVVNPGSTIGANAILNTGCTVDHHNSIGEHAQIAPGAHLGGNVEIGAGTLIGMGATVMPQRRVGAWCVVGAATLVHVSHPDQVVVVGVPGRVIRHTNTS